MGELAVGENFVYCLIIVAKSMGPGKAYILGEILISSMGGRPQRDGTIFMGRVDPLRHHVKILIWQLGEG